MKLCTQTQTFFNHFGEAEGTRMLKEAGFDYLDLSLFDMARPDHAWSGDDYREKAKHLRTLAEQNGIEYYQAHAPFPSNKEGDLAYDAFIFDQIVRALEVAALAGCKCIVVHPKILTDKAAQHEANIAFYRALLPHAEAFGIIVMTENMFALDGRRQYLVETCFSYGRELRAFSELINHPNFGVCLDLGHSGLIGEDADVAIRAIGHEHLTALHVHDNDYRRDLHTMPYNGKMEWSKILVALADIRYKGVFTLEADNFLNGFPEALLFDAAQLMERTAREMIRTIEAHQTA